MNSFNMTRSTLAIHFVQAGILKKDAADDLLHEAKIKNIRFIECLIQNKILTGEEILHHCEKIFNLPTFDLADYDESSTLLHPDLIRQHRVIPLQKNNNIIHLGVSDPTEQHAIEAITFHTQCNVKLVLVDEEKLTNIIENNYNHEEINKNFQALLLEKIKLDETQHAIHEKTTSENEPLIQFVDNIIQTAIQQNSSDIHIESHEKICRIRYRQNGILYPANEIPNPFADRIITRLKVMSNLNIADKRLPQDGRFHFGTTDIRINTCPTLFGEKVVLRILNAPNMLLNLNELGLTSSQKKLLIHNISQSQGMVLVTGPTGSGKTVTLYSALTHLNQTEKNISTVEDPIEIRLDGINQVNVNAKIGLDFAMVLRAFLRQDPDILMIGEIRDTETANIAIQASQTGHLVLSTLHTNSAIETITRLQAMKIHSYNIAESISLIIAQRLIRILCEHCKQPEKTSLYPFLKLENKNLPEWIYRATGCKNCIHGYKNRTAIYEFLPIDEKISQAILSNHNTHALLSQAKKNGFISLKEAMIEKVLQGVTSLAEVNRVLQL